MVISHLRLYTMPWQRSYKPQSRLSSHQRTQPRYRRLAICQKPALRYQCGEKKTITIYGKAYSCREYKRQTFLCEDHLINRAQPDSVAKAATLSCLHLGEHRPRIHLACKVLQNHSSLRNRHLRGIPGNSSDQLRRLHPRQREWLH